MLPSRLLLPSGTGPRERRLGTFLWREDPLADAAVAALAPLPRAEQEALVDRLVAPAPGTLPEPLQALREALEVRPLWLDVARAEAGGRVVLRTGVLSGLVLAFKSLVLGYCSPGGNKPLAFSGRLLGDVNRRLGETSRFVEAVSSPGGLALGAPGFTALVRVRLIHARVRQGLRVSPAWRAADWGAPLNQYDQAGTVLLFSSQLLEGLRQLGAQVTDAEEEALLHLWRYAGRVLGVEEELLATSRQEAASLWALLEATQGPPDADSRRLTHALLDSGRERGASPGALDLGHALCRHLVGPRYAGALELRRTRWDLAPAVLQRVVARLDRTLGRLPVVRDGALQAGARSWRRAVERALGTAEVPFALPAVPLREVRG